MAQSPVSGRCSRAVGGGGTERQLGAVQRQLEGYERQLVERELAASQQRQLVERELE
jgi:hypothetical protein